MIRKCSVGDIFKNNKGSEFQIIEYKDKNNVRIKFLDEYGYEKNTQNTNIYRGSISNPYDKSIYGIGFIGSETLNSKSEGYNIWQHMIRRCYDENYHIKHPTYKNVTVCKEWHNFSNFNNWYEKNYPYCVDGIDFELDKDLLSQVVEYKSYSPQSCIFLPKKVNSFLINKQSHNSTGVIGVNWCNRDKKYLVQIRDYDLNKRVVVGRFDSLEEADKCYKEHRIKNCEVIKNYMRQFNLYSEEIINLIK